jgi:hypothetical protein
MDRKTRLAFLVFIACMVWINGLLIAGASPHNPSSLVVYRYTNGAGMPVVVFQGRPGILEAEDSLRVGNHGQPISLISNGDGQLDEEDTVVYKIRTP